MDSNKKIFCKREESHFVKNKAIFSMILYGNPGIGKTAAARIALEIAKNKSIASVYYSVNNNTDDQAIFGKDIVKDEKPDKAE